VGRSANGIGAVGNSAAVGERCGRSAFYRNLTDDASGYYGITVGERTLLPGDAARLGETRLDDRLRTAAVPSTVA